MNSSVAVFEATELRRKGPMGKKPKTKGKGEEVTEN